MYQDSDLTFFKELVLSVLREFGFEYDNHMDSDLTDPRASYIEEGGILLVLDVGDKIVGCCGSRPIDNKSMMLKRMYITPEMRGKGYGQQLLDQVIDFCKRHHYQRILLDTHIQFSQGLHFYQKNGFKEVQREGNLIYLEKKIL